MLYLIRPSGAFHTQEVTHAFRRDLHGTFGQIWRHKRFWLFGLLGLALTSIGLLIYQVFQYRWQSEWFSTMGEITQNFGQMPDRYFSNMLSTMVWLWVGMGVWMVVGLLGYIITW